VVVEQGEVRQDSPLVERCTWLPTFEEERVPDIQKWFESFYTIQFANNPVDAAYLAHGATAVDCQPGR
jgi:formylmethanofuran dehydrogenase subunit A